MNTTLKLIQNANSLNIDIPKLLTYMSIVWKNSNIESDKIIEGFSSIFERINRIWANDESEDWNNIKSISKKHEISLIVLAVLLRTHCYLSVFCKSEFITALAGESKRNILLTLVENYKKGTDVDAVEMMATTMLKSMYDN